MVRPNVNGYLICVILRLVECCVSGFWDKNYTISFLFVLILLSLIRSLEIDWFICEFSDSVVVYVVSAFIALMF